MTRNVRQKAGRNLPPFAWVWIETHRHFSQTLLADLDYPMRAIKFDSSIVNSIEMYSSIMYTVHRDVNAFFCGETTMTIEEILVREYGPLLSLSELAIILDRTPAGLRSSLRSSGEWINRINAARLRLGRRVYFRTSEIATVLDAR
jgi:hypothetical protein